MTIVYGTRSCPLTAELSRVCFTEADVALLTRRLVSLVPSPSLALTIKGVDVACKYAACI